MNENTGVISSATGTAEVASVTKGDYTVTASDGVDEQSQTFFLEIAPPLIVEWMLPLDLHFVNGQVYPNAIKVSGGLGVISASIYNPHIYRLFNNVKSTATSLAFLTRGYISVEVKVDYIFLPVSVLAYIKDELGNFAIIKGGADGGSDLVLYIKSSV